MRLVFWGGALAVGVVSVGFAALATQATHLFRGILFAPWFALILTPSGFCTVGLGGGPLLSGLAGFRHSPGHCRPAHEGHRRLAPGFCR